MVASTKLADLSTIPVFRAEECPAATVRMPLRENAAGPCTFSAVFPEAFTPVPLALNPLTPGPAPRFSPDTALADAARRRVAPGQREPVPGRRAKRGRGDLTVQISDRHQAAIGCLLLDDLDDAFHAEPGVLAMVLRIHEAG